MSTDPDAACARMTAQLDTIRDSLTPEMQEAHDQLLDSLRSAAESFAAIEVGLVKEWLARDRRR